MMNIIVGICCDAFIPVAIDMSFGAMLSCKKEGRDPKLESKPTEAPKPADSN